MYTGRTPTVTKARGPGGQTSCRSTPSPGDEAMALFNYKLSVGLGVTQATRSVYIASARRGTDKSFLISRANVTHTRPGGVQVAGCFRG